MNDLIANESQSSVLHAPEREQDQAQQPTRVAILNNLLPPYWKPVFACLAARYPNLRIFVSTPMEPNRSWDVDWQGLDVVLQKTITLRGSWRHPKGFAEPLFIHLPLDTVAQLKSFRADVILSAEMGFRTLLALLYRKLHSHSRLIIWAEISESTERGRGFLRHLVRLLLARHADAFIVFGDSGARYIKSLRVSDSKIFTIPYATDVDRFACNSLKSAKGTAARRQTAKELAEPLGGALDSGPVLRGFLEKNSDCVGRWLYVGQLIERKGLLPFLKVAIEWASAHPDQTIEFLLVGEGPLRGDLEKICCGANLKIKLLGNIPYPDLPRIYAESGLFVFPTLADTWGLVVNEAMASGLPVLGSNYSQAVEMLVSEDQNGWKFFPDDAAQTYATIERAMNTPVEKFRRMREHARATAVRQHPAHVAELIDNALTACLQTRS